MNRSPRSNIRRLAVAESSFWSASVAAIPALAESEADIARANSLVAVGRNAGIMLGPVFGGLLVTWLGASWVFALNGITFVVSVALTISVRGSYREAATSADEQEEHRGMAAGVRFVWKEH